jgi:hypothetical protein
MFSVPMAQTVERDVEQASPVATAVADSRRYCTDDHVDVGDGAVVAECARGLIPFDELADDSFDSCTSLASRLAARRLPRRLDRRGQSTVGRQNLADVVEVASERLSRLGVQEALGTGEVLDLGEAVLGCGLDEVPVGGKVAIDSADADSGCTGYLGQLHLVAALGEQNTSRFQDAGPVARGVGSRPAGWWRT